MANVLVTGGTGFIGSRVCAALHEQGDTVHVLSRNPDTCTNQIEISKNILRLEP